MWAGPTPTGKSMWAGPTLIEVPIGIITAFVASQKNRKGCRVVGVPRHTYIV